MRFEAVDPHPAFNSGLISSPELRIPLPHPASGRSPASILEVLGYVMSKLIAISATADSSKISLSLNYARSLEGAGLVPMIVPPLTDPTRAGDILDSVGGLLLTGGEDVDPKRYRAPPHPKLGKINPQRDATDLALLEAARDRPLPVLAICRGIQILNVAFGGTLYQDL